MKPAISVLAGLALLAIAGCRTDPRIAMLERDNRLKEDEIYRLRAALDQIQDCGPPCSDRVTGGNASSAEREDAAPRRRHDPVAPNGERPPLAELPSQSTTVPPELVETPRGSPPSGGPEVPPELQGPSKPLPPGRMGRPAAPRRRSGVGKRHGRNDLPIGPCHAGFSVAIRRAVDPFGRQSAGRRDGPQPHAHRRRQRRGRPGRSGATGGRRAPRPCGRAVDAPADVSVVVIDSALEGNAARVARWDFTAAETAAMFRRSGASLAIHLTMAWPGDPPVHHKLHLFVRYVTADGRKLQADQPIEVASGRQDDPLDAQRVAGPCQRRSRREAHRADPRPHAADRSAVGPAGGPPARLVAGAMVAI